MDTTVVYRGYIRIMENKMDTTIVYRGYIGIMEKKMETTVVYGEENGNYCSIWGLYRENTVDG